VVTGGFSAPRDLTAVRERIRSVSPLPPDETEAVIRARFDSVPNRLAFALETWPLGESRVLDCGCSFGHCLVQFGEGSLGIDNLQEQVDFCRALGLDAVRADLDDSLDAVPDESFDFIWVADILEHLDAPRLLLRRLAPKLAPGGRLLVYITALPRSRLVQRALRQRGVRAFEAGTHYYQFTDDSARYLVERAGYCVTRVVSPGARRLPAPLRPLVVRQSPTLIIEAVPDAQASQLVLSAEAKNKPVAAA
jgi:SAM-dependent methyltransferase